MRDKWLRRATGWIRLALLATTLLAIDTFVVFWRAPHLVSALDSAIVRGYENRYERKFRAATDLPAEKRRITIRRLESLMSSLEDVRRRDRLMRLKRDAMHALTDALVADNRLEEALGWCDRWLSLDARDLIVETRRAELLLRVPDRSDEGVRALEALYAKVPEVETVADAYGHMLAERGRRAEAAAFYPAHYRFRYRNGLLRWSLWWSHGNLFGNSQKSDYSQNLADRVRFPVSIPGTAGRLRVELPSNVPVEMSRPELRFPGAGKTVRLWTVDAEFTPSVSRRGETVYSAGGSRPRVTFSFPPVSASEARIDAEFRAAIRPALPPLLKASAGGAP